MSTARHRGRVVGIAFACVGAVLAVCVLIARTERPFEVAPHPPADVTNAAEPSRVLLDAPPAEPRPAPQLAAEPSVSASVFDIHASATQLPSPPSGTLNVEFVDVGATRLHGVSGTLTLAPGPGWTSTASGPPPASRRVEFPEEGRIEFDSLPFGPWTLAYSAVGFRRGSEPFTIDARHPTKWLHVPLAVHRDLHISLRDTSGVPFIAQLEREFPQLVRTLRFELSRADGDEPSAFVAYRGLGLERTTRPSDAAHWCSVSVASRDALNVSVRVGTALVGRAAVAKDGTEVTVFASLSELRGTLGSLHVLVIDDVERPVANARLALRGASSFTAEASTDASGRAKFERIPSEKLDVSVNATGCLDAGGSVVVAPDVTTSWTLRVDASVSLSGFVRAATPIQRVLVAYTNAVAAESGAPVEWALEFATEGRFALSPLRKDVYWVGAYELPPDLDGRDFALRLTGVSRSALIDVRRVDARFGDVSNLVLVVPAAVSK